MTEPTPSTPAAPTPTSPPPVVPPTPVDAPDEQLAKLLDGAVEEPMQDESVGVLGSRRFLSESADLDGERPDDAVGEAREQWWEPSDEPDEETGGPRPR